MLYPKEDKENKVLLYACRNCDYKQIASNNCIYGQAHNMFSRIFPNTNLQIFSTKYFVIFVYIFSNDQNWEWLPFLTNREFVFVFQLSNIGEKICRFVFGKFVKTCREFHNSEQNYARSWRIDQYCFWCHWRSHTSKIRGTPMSQMQTSRSRLFPGIYVILLQYFKKNLVIFLKT